MSLASVLKSIKQRIDIVTNIGYKVEQATRRFNDVKFILDNLYEIEREFNLKLAKLITNEPTDVISHFERLLSEVKLISVINQSVRKLHEIITMERKVTAKEYKNDQLIIKQIENFFEMMSISSILIGNFHAANITKQKYMICDECECEMILDIEKSEMLCSNIKCSTFKKLDGFVAQISQQYGQESQKVRNGKFLPDRHLKSWLIRLQGKEDDSELGSADDPLGEKLIERIRNILTNDNEVLRLIDPYKIRNILKRINKTKYNKNIPKIIKKLTGVHIPSIPDEIINKISKIFSRVVEIHGKIHPNNKPNRNFYPYYIFKILELIVPEDNELRQILFYIYHQSQKTLNASDYNWKTIVEYLKKGDNTINYRFIPTSRFKTFQYAAK